VWGGNEIIDLKSRMRAMHDGKGVADHLYEVGQYVWFNIKNIALRHDSRRHKLLPKFWGPFRVIELIGRNALRLDMASQLQHIHLVVSVSLVKPFKRRSGDVLPPVLIDGTLEYEVDDIVDYNIVASRGRNVPSVVEFRVRWKGACDDSWHEPQDFEHSQDILVSFLQKLTKSQRIKVLKTFDLESLSRLPLSLRSLIGS
jgi:hypothetical protein